MVRCRHGDEGYRVGAKCRLMVVLLAGLLVACVTSTDRRLERGHGPLTREEIRCADFRESSPSSSCWSLRRAVRRQARRGTAPTSRRHRSTPTSPALPDTTLSAWTSEGGTRLEILQDLAKQFEEEYPNITVKWTVRDFAAYPAQIKLALNSDDGPDVCIGNLGWALDGPLIKAGLLRPLDDYAEAYGWDTRYPEVGLRQLKFSEDGTVYGEGPIFGTPYASDVIGWFYNKDLLDDLGMEVPQTMDELEAILQASKDAGQQPILIGNKDGWPIWHLLYNVIDQTADAEEISGIVYNDEGASYESDGIKAGVEQGRGVERRRLPACRRQRDRAGRRGHGLPRRQGAVLPRRIVGGGEHARQRRLLRDSAARGGRHLEVDRLVRLLVAHLGQQRQGCGQRCVPRLDVERERRPGVLRRW